MQGSLESGGSGQMILFARRAAQFKGWQGRNDTGVDLLLREQRMGWSLMIFCARAKRGLRKPSLDARNGRSINPYL